MVDVKVQDNPAQLRAKARKIKNEAEKIRLMNPPKYIEKLKEFWALNTEAARLEDL